MAVCARPPPHEQLRRPLASRAGRSCPTRSPGRCEARVSGTCTRSHASRRPHAQQPAAAAVAAAIAHWGSTRTTFVPRLPSGGTVLLEPVRCSAVELARRCGAGDFAFRGRMFSERDYCDSACTHARQRANSALPLWGNENPGFLQNDKATEYVTEFPRRNDKIPQPLGHSPWKQKGTAPQR